MVDRYADALRSLRAVWIDAGTRRRVLPRPGRRGVPGRRWTGSACRTSGSHFELFDAGHGGIDYRYPLALAWLAHRLERA